ncbi:MAG: hypothetical protein DWQ05_06505 [Calditrichaeota bacterium]|nr:MAG: hypothetical protein DWQ05_06505 [Calditrichota bacterium]
MNIYLVVEGFGEKEVYSRWVPYLNSKFTIVQNINDVKKNNIFIVSGGGYPNYFDVITAGAKDVSENNNFDRFIVAIDSEDMTYNDKKNEIDNFISDLNFDIEYKIIVQHFCLETWGLGNQFIVARNPNLVKVKRYRKIWDVLDNDPELLPDLNSDGLNRAQFAERYLRALLNDKYRNLTYTKKKPKVLYNRKYFQRIRSRFNDTNHIKSFNDFIDAFNSR